MPFTRLAPLSAAIVLLLARVAQAGMPSVGLTEFAHVRLSIISFFLLGLALSAVAIRLIWNWLANDFAWLPRLTFTKACALVTLWGLLFVVVLAMISGARELMTPGAWRKTGLTYALADESTQPPIAIDAAAIEERQMHLRRAKLQRLSAALHRFAATHDGKFPKSLDEISATETWDVPGFPGTRYILRPVADISDSPGPLAHEPEVFEGDPLVLLTSGEIVQRPASSLSAAENP